MTRREAWIAGIAAALGALGAWLWLANAGRDPAALAERGPGPAVVETPPPRSLDAIDLDATEETVDATSGAGARAEPPTLDARSAALHVPDYGPALQRPSATALFELRDARGMPLETEALPDSAPRAELRRRTRSGWTRHAVEFDGSRLLCRGPGSGGLPPGQYVLHVRAGPYGELEAPFELGRDQSIERTLEFPRWRRIVRLEFVDGQGRPLPRLTQRPRCDFDVPANEVDRAHVAEGRLARLEEASAADTPGPLGRTNLGWEAYYLTDGGSFHVRVFAGLPSRLKLDLENSLYGRSSLELESDFTEPEWDRFQVVLEPVPELESRMESWVCINPDDPGSKSLLQAPALQVVRAPDPWELSGMLPGRFRVIVEIDAPVSVRMLSEAGTPVRGPGEMWFLDVHRVSDADSLRIRYAFTDDELFRMEARPLDLHEAELSAPIVRDRVRLDGAAIELEVAAPTPTLAAYATRVQLAISSASPWTERTTTLARGDDGVFRVRTALSAADASVLASKAAATIRFQAGEQQGVAMQCNLHGAQRALFAAGGVLSFPLASGDGTGLVCRVVDRDSIGVDGAHIALIDEASLGSAESRLLLAREGDPDQARTSEAPARAPSLAGIVPTRASDPPKRIAARAAGSARDILVADEFGYVVSDKTQLAPGRRYAFVVLWIDDDGAVHDHVVRFVASAGLQDLGAIRLP